MATKMQIPVQGKRVVSFITTTHAGTAVMKRNVCRTIRSFENVFKSATRGASQ